eukprot:gene40365-54592_t
MKRSPSHPVARSVSHGVPLNGRGRLPPQFLPVTARHGHCPQHPRAAGRGRRRARAVFRMAVLRSVRITCDVAVATDTDASRTRLLARLQKGRSADGHAGAAGDGIASPADEALSLPLKPPTRATCDRIQLAALPKRLKYSCHRMLLRTSVAGWSTMSLDQPATEVRKSIRHKTVAAAVADALRQRILAGEFAAGAQLRQDALAIEFGISRIPVREALLQLEASGLVKIVPHRGAVVSGLSLEEIEDIFQLRVQPEHVAIKGAHALDVAHPQCRLADAQRRGIGEAGS